MDRLPKIIDKMRQKMEGYKPEIRNHLVYTKAYYIIGGASDYLAKDLPQSEGYIPGRIVSKILRSTPGIRFAPGTTFEEVIENMSGWGWVETSDDGRIRPKAA